MEQYIFVPFQTFEYHTIFNEWFGGKREREKEKKGSTKNYCADKIICVRMYEINCVENIRCVCCVWMMRCLNKYDCAKFLSHQKIYWEPNQASAIHLSPHMYTHTHPNTKGFKYLRMYIYLTINKEWKRSSRMEWAVWYSVKPYLVWLSLM